MNLPETLQVDPEHYEVTLKEIQFPHLWYNVGKDKNHFIGCYNTVIWRPSNKRVEFKFMEEIKPSYYSSISEIIAELNAKMPAEPKNINLHLDGFDICFNYDSFSSNCMSMESHGLSPFMANMKRYTTLYVYTDIIQNQLVGNVRAPLL